MTEIPAYIVEDHSDIYEPIVKNLRSKRIPFQDNVLIHFDAHPDFLIDTDLTSSDIYEKRAVDKMSIETWILPLVFPGHITSVVWIKPKWACQIDDGTHLFVIGEDKYKNIKVSLPNLYFISALNYAHEDQLVNKRNVRLDVITIDESADSVQNCINQVMKLIHNKSFILDIDLDFFATENPFLKLYQNCDVYNHLRVIYEFEERELQKSLEKAVEKRKHQIESLETVFTTINSISQNGTHQDILDYVNKLSPNVFCNVKAYEAFIKMCTDLIKHSQETEPMDWLLIHDGGTTIDDSARELPHHSDLEDMTNLLSYFTEILNGLEGTPCLISIARSSEDEYCPAHLVNKIQKSVLESLNKKYSSIKVTKLYGTES